MCAAAFPLSDDVRAFGDQIRDTPEIEVWEGPAEVAHEGLDVIATAARLVERILQQHVRCGDVVDDSEVALLAPKVGEPSADYVLVVFLFAHVHFPLDAICATADWIGD